MPLAVLSASHTPLMRDGITTDEVRDAVKAGFSQLAERAENFNPDLVIQFAPDHFNGFFYDVMPSFCVGVNATSIGDWDTAVGRLPVASAEALQLSEALLNDGLDVAVSYQMEVDHGFVQIWEEMFGSFAKYPCIPIFINCAAPPLPTFKRARLLGEAVGRFAAATGKRVLFSASGGLSHDPPTPSIVSAPDDVKARLIDGRNPTREMRHAREERVRAAGVRALEGHPSILQVDANWDKDFIAQLQGGNLRDFDALTTAEVREKAGRGGPEVLAWVAAFAALSVAGEYKADLLYYEAIQGWIAGMAMMFAESKTPRA
ncbi:3-carboxyethylcatechol 2,3-dioxygenase [Paraburkholderia sp. BL25I1N1]|uniref:3-carboxyethylcatechol 2,3-dioxygenase n=1 Tax=Paraburkholderia sp. BL25I1N1 TaxID=1938804 RepID=UPI000D074A2B|nr:3-carboxyethylcatechol 2,3-dioxygenase [Paraburkholderia sp. BL25I1N1]PRY05967.1 2,3-dihydroxyphenylpropionate 1,2-dioxygenase [Paraburkholderia sp. BL25I1N1]